MGHFKDFSNWVDEVVPRNKDLEKVSTSNFYPQWIERNILQSGQATLGFYRNTDCVRGEELLGKIKKILLGIGLDEPVDTYLKGYRKFYGGAISYKHVYGSERMFVGVTYVEGSNLEINNISVDGFGPKDEVTSGIWNRIHELILEHKAPLKSTTGSVGFIVPTNGGLTKKKVGNLGYDFEPDNYDPDVLDKIKNKVFAEIGKKNPRGRLFLLSGVPGVGKTVLIRSIIKYEPNCNYLLIAASYVKSLESPEGLSFLLDQATGGFPTVLIIEDADEAISVREKGNLSHLSAVLNMTDGILGTAIDLRIILTSNLELDAIDTAITRKGRLGAHIEIPPLKAEQANRVYKRLGGSGEPFEKGELVPLGDVYGLLCSSDEGLPKKKRRVLGFATQAPTPEDAPPDANPLNVTKPAEEPVFGTPEWDAWRKYTEAGYYSSVEVDGIDGSQEIREAEVQLEKDEDLLQKLDQVKRALDSEGKIGLMEELDGLRKALVRGGLVTKEELAESHQRWAEKSDDELLGGADWLDEEESVTFVRRNGRVEKVDEIDRL